MFLAHFNEFFCSPVVRLSVRPSVHPSVNFSNFHKLLQDHWAISIKLSKNILWWRQVCSNEGSNPFPRGENYERAKIYTFKNPLLQNHSANFNETWHKASLEFFILWFVGFFTHSIIFHSFRDVTITVKDLQLLTCTRSHISASIGTPLNCFVKSRQHGGKPLSIWYINIDVYLSARIYHMSTFCISYLKVVILLQDSIKNVLYPRFSLHLLFQKLHP